MEHFFLHIIYAHHRMVGCAQALHGGQADLLFFTQGGQGRNDFFAPVHAHHIVGAKFAVFHRVSSLLDPNDGFAAADDFDTDADTDTDRQGCRPLRWGILFL